MSTPTGGRWRARSIARRTLALATVGAVAATTALTAVVVGSAPAVAAERDCAITGVTVTDTRGEDVAGGQVNLYSEMTVAATWQKNAACQIASGDTATLTFPGELWVAGTAVTSDMRDGDGNFLGTVRLNPGSGDRPATLVLTFSDFVGSGTATGKSKFTETAVTVGSETQLVFTTGGGASFTTVTTPTVQGGGSPTPGDVHKYCYWKTGVEGVGYCEIWLPKTELDGGGTPCRGPMSRSPRR